SVHMPGVTLVVAQEFFRSELAIVVLVTKQACADGQLLVVSGYGVRLRIVHHLKFVFHIAQKDVSATECLVLLRRQKRLAAQCRERLHRVSMAYLRDRGAMSDLE